MDTVKVSIRKLSRPARISPESTLIATLHVNRADGARESSGAWFGVDRAELRARVIRWAIAQGYPEESIS